LIVLDFILYKLVLRRYVLIEPEAEHVGFFAVMHPFWVSCILLFWEGYAGYKPE